MSRISTITSYEESKLQTLCIKREKQPNTRTPTRCPIEMKQKWILRIFYETGNGVLYETSLTTSFPTLFQPDAGPFWRLSSLQELGKIGVTNDQINDLFKNGFYFDEKGSLKCHQCDVSYKTRENIIEIKIKHDPSCDYSKQLELQVPHEDKSVSAEDENIQLESKQILDVSSNNKTSKNKKKFEEVKLDVDHLLSHLKYYKELSRHDSPKIPRKSSSKRNRVFSKREAGKRRTLVKSDTKGEELLEDFDYDETDGAKCHKKEDVNEKEDNVFGTGNNRLDKGRSKAENDRLNIEQTRYVVANTVHNQLEREAHVVSVDIDKQHKDDSTCVRCSKLLPCVNMMCNHYICEECIRCVGFCPRCNKKILCCRCKLHGVNTILKTCCHLTCHECSECVDFCSQCDKKITKIQLIDSLH